MKCGVFMIDFSLYENELTFGIPIEYFSEYEKKYKKKEKSINIFEVPVRKYFDFYVSINCLLLDKNIIPDVNIVQMSYLDYLFYLKDYEDNPLYLGLMNDLFRMCFRMEDDEEIMWYFDGKKHILKIKDVYLDKNDFENIKEIICLQNDIDLSEFELDPEVRKQLQRVKQYKAKHDTSVFSLENKIDGLIVSSNYNEEELLNLSIRKFTRILRRADHKLHYEIYKNAESSGMVKFKTPIKHWLDNLDDDPNDDFVVDYEGVKKKVTI